MKRGTVIDAKQTLPERLLNAIHRRFPDKTVDDLSIRYYNNVKDVGYEFYMEQVLPGCMNDSAIHYIAPFISYVRLGEALILDNEDGIVVYESDENDCCTETGPFWLIMPKVATAYGV